MAYTIMIDAGHGGACNEIGHIPFDRNHALKSLYNMLTKYTSTYPNFAHVFGPTTSSFLL